MQRSPFVVSLSPALKESHLIAFLVFLAGGSINSVSDKAEWHDAVRTNLSHLSFKDGGFQPVLAIIGVAHDI